jgi:hypothetical protein
MQSVFSGWSKCPVSGNSVLSAEDPKAVISNLKSIGQEGFKSILA